jgi:hypothetical protein
MKKENISASAPTWKRICLKMTRRNNTTKNGKTLCVVSLSFIDANRKNMFLLLFIVCFVTFLRYFLINDDIMIPILL